MTVLNDLSDLLEKLTDEYADASFAAAEAENEAERIELLEFARLQASGVPVTAVGKLAKAKAVDERAVARILAATERSTKRKVETTEARMNAAQSHMRFIRSQTGGDA